MTTGDENIACFIEPELRFKCFSVCACGKWVCTSDKCSGGKMGKKMRTAEGERKTETRIWTRKYNENKTKGGKSESEINIGRKNIEYDAKESESELDIGRNSIEYDTKEIDLLKEGADDKEEEEDPEDDPDVQDIRWF